MSVIDIEMQRFENVAVSYFSKEDKFIWSDESILETSIEYRKNFEQKIRELTKTKKNETLGN